MNEARINTIYWVPSAMNMIANFKALDEHRLPFLKTVLFAGEAMPTTQLNYWRRHLSADTLYANLFGPTETTDTVSYTHLWDFYLYRFGVTTLFIYFYCFYSCFICWRQ